MTKITPDNVLELLKKRSAERHAERQKSLLAKQRSLDSIRPVKPVLVMFHCIPFLIALMYFLVFVLLFEASLAYEIFLHYAIMLMVSMVINMMANTIIERDFDLMMLMLKSGYSLIVLGVVVFLAAFVLREYPFYNALLSLSILMVFYGFALAMGIASEPISRHIIERIERHFPSVSNRLYSSAFEGLALLFVFLIALALTMSLATVIPEFIPVHHIKQ